MPFDVSGLIDLTNNIKKIITIEEHNLNGGLGSAVAEVLADQQIDLENFKRIGLENKFSSVVGSQEFLRNYYNMDSHAILSIARGWF